MKKTMQIDVKGLDKNNNDYVEMNLIFEGCAYQCYISKKNYETLIHEGLFIRDGKERDSADILNTTKLFIEK